MPTTPETLRPEIPSIKERQEEFIVDETLKNTGVQVVQKNFKAQIANDNGAQVVQTPPTQVITIQPPADQTTLQNQSKGQITDSKTWFAAFWIRIIKKAIHFGWKILGHG